MSRFRKSILAVAGLATAFAMLGVVAIPSANAQTVEELQAQINALMATISQLQSVIAGIGGGTGSTPAMGAFTQNLTIGSTGSEVMQLQKFLNSKGFTVAASGAGSPGSESSYFGGLTKAALARYQAANGITTAVGYFGPITRANVNQMLVVTPGTPSTPGTLPAGCTSTAGYSSTTGVKCDSTTTTPVTPGQGTEGSITASVASIPVDSANIRSSSNVPIYGLEIDAIGSDMKVDRFDIQMSVIPTNGSAQNPANFVKKLYFYDGGTLLREMSLVNSDFNKDSSDRYHVIVSGLGFNVLKGTTKIMTIKADVSSIDTSDVNRAVVIKGYAGNTNNVRATDTAGFQSYADVSAAAEQRSHTFKPAGDATVTVTKNSAKTPYSTNNQVNSTTGASKLTMLAINVKAETGDAIITKIFASSSATSTPGYPNTLYLYEDGVTEPIATVADGATKGTVVFNSLKINVAQDTTKVLLIKADFPTTAGGQAASTTLPANAVQWEKPGGSTASTSNTAVITGNDQYLFGRAPKYTINGTIPTPVIATETSVGLSTTTITFKIPIMVQGLGGNINFKPLASDFVLVISSSTATSTFNLPTNQIWKGFSAETANTYIATTTVLKAGSILASTTVTLDSPSPTTDGGDSYTFTLTGTIKNRTEFGKIIGATTLTPGGTNTGGNYRMILVAASSTVDSAVLSNQTWGLDNFETASAFLPGS